MSARSESFIEIADESEGFLFSEKGFLKFTPNRKLMIAACVDGLIYKFDYDSTTNTLRNMMECSNVALPITEHIGMISVSNLGDVAFASESNELVRLYKMNEDGQFGELKLVTKSAGSTDAIALNPSGTMLCCSGKDNIVKVINVKDGQEFPVLNQIPSTHFVKSITFAEDGNLFAILQVDGICRIFSIIENNPAPQLHKMLTGVRSDINSKFQLSWKGNVLGVLYGGEHLRVYETGKWTIKSEMSVKNCKSFELISSEVGLLTFSSGEVSIYSIERNQIIGGTDYNKGIESCSIAAANETFACLVDSDYYCVKIEINPKDLIKPEDKKTKLYKLSRKETKERKKSRFISDEAEGSEDEEEEEDDDDREDGFEDDLDLDGGEDNIDTENESNDLGFDSEEDAQELSFAKETVLLKKHPIVQPCCTPWRNLQRYLAYNNVGYITSRRSLDEKEPTVNYDIEFMDRSAHQPVRFSNEISFKMAALSEKGAVFAADGAGACLHYVPLENPAETWNVPLSLDSEPILLGINSFGIYVVNSRGVLNIYSLSGLLQSSSTCPGKPISLVCPDGNVIYMFTDDSDGVQCYKLNSRNGGVLSVPSRVLLSGSETNNLVWCGLSFSGVLGAYTSKGKFLIQLTRETDRWTEILDTARTLSDRFELSWPVYFDVNTLSGIVCKKADVYPDPYPAPHVIDFEFKIPEIETDPSYEEVVRTGWILNETCNSSKGLTDRERKKVFATSDRHLLELAQLSLKSNRIDRLTDLARWSSNERTTDLLIQLAKHHKLVAIVEEMEFIKMEMFYKQPVIETVSKPLKSSVSNLKSSVDSSVKESPSGILANLTPLKQHSSLESVINADQVISSSPAELLASPSNPFAKENSSTSAVAAYQLEPNNAMLDYISAMINLNNSGKRKATENEQVNSKKRVQ